MMKEFNATIMRMPTIWANVMMKLKRMSPKKKDENQRDDDDFVMIVPLVIKLTRIRRTSMLNSVVISITYTGTDSHHPMILGIHSNSYSGKRFSNTSNLRSRNNQRNLKTSSTVTYLSLTHQLRAPRRTELI